MQSKRFCVSTVQTKASIGSIPYDDASTSLSATLVLQRTTVYRFF